MTRLFPLALPLISGCERASKETKEKSRRWLKRGILGTIFRCFVALAAFALFFIVLFLFASTTNRCPTLYSSSSSSSHIVTRSSRPPPLRVYMYDLPPRFNSDMLGSRRGLDPSELPPWPKTSGLRKQYSGEYWMMASLVDGGRGEWPEAVRVSDPEEAEVFFVPFLASLSFNKYGSNMSHPNAQIDRQLQIDLLDFLMKSKYWQRSGGRDHVISMHQPNALRFIRDQLNASILVVADFGRSDKSVSSLRKDIVAPYVHIVNSYVDDDPSDPFESRSTLLFFRGKTVRKDGGIVRQKLIGVLKGYDDVYFEDGSAVKDGIEASTQGMRSSKYCLHPAGDTPSSCRLFDAIVSHCVPVIVSDQIELPFEDEIDYSEFSIFFSVKEALTPDYIVSHLRQIPSERWIQMWRKLKEKSHHYEYDRPTKRDDAVNMLWRQVRSKLPSANLAAHRSRRLKIPDWWN